jgi:putative ABC transport system substrate-binding protein
MRRREFIGLFGSTVVAWPLTARAQQPTSSIPRVGWLVTGSPTSHRFSLAAFQNGLRALGYIEGQNINFEYRWAEGDLSRIPELANDLVRQKVDVILAGGTPVVETASVPRQLFPS